MLDVGFFPRCISCGRSRGYVSCWLRPERGRKGGRELKIRVIDTVAQTRNAGKLEGKGLRNQDPSAQTSGDVLSFRASPSTGRP